MNDPFGAAIQDFYLNKNPQKIIVNSNYTEDEEINPSYFFRKYNEMPAIEQKALNVTYGKTLDIGAAAGCHSIVLQDKEIDVTALDQSYRCCKVMKQRGISNVILQNIFDYNDEKYDTLLLLMNGTGIGGSINGLKELLLNLKSILNTKGQILLDSSDIKYLFYEDDGSYWIDINNSQYYGEMQYQVDYKEHSSTFDWLFIDYDRLKSIAKTCKLKIEKICEGEHHDYLARLY